MLTRLYREYKYLSGYTHSGQVKMAAQGVSDRLFRIPSDKRDKYFQNEIVGPAVFTSLCASVSACNEVYNHFRGGDDLELVAALTKQWESLKSTSLLATALWELRGRYVLNFEIGV